MSPAVELVATGIVTLVPVDEVIVRLLPVPVMPRFVATLTCAPAAMPSSLVLSAALIAPGADVLAARMLSIGVLPPLETIGAVPLTELTPAVAVVI